MRFLVPQNRTLQAATREGSGLSFAPIGDTAEHIVSGLREPAQTRRTLTEEAWVAFLSCHEWQWFGTFTYKDPIHPEAADKQFRFWTREIDRTFGDVPKTALRNSPRRLMWTRGLEWQKRGVLHYHALLRNVRPELDCIAVRQAAQQTWQNISGGFAFVVKSTSEAVLSYVTKYSAKGGEVDFSANFELPDGGASSAPLLAIQHST